jgi:signal transduction histidine kinase
MRFASKLSLMVIMVSVITVPPLGIAIFYFTKSIVELNITSAQLRQTDGILNDIDRSLYNAYQDIQLIAHDSLLREFMQTTDQTEKVIQGFLGDRQFIDGFNSKTELTGPWDLLIIMDIEGTIVYSTQHRITGKNAGLLPAVRSAHYAALAGRSYYSDLLETELINRPTILFAAPVTDEVSGVISGTVVGFFSWPIILQILDRTHSSKQIQLFNRAGVVIATPSQQNDAIFKTRLGKHELIDRLLSGEQSVSGTDTFDGNYGNVLATAVSQSGYLGFRGNDWGLVLGVPTRIAFAPVFQLARTITIAIVVIMVIITVIVYLLAKRIARPIETLKNAAVAIGKGQIALDISIDTGDELEALGVAFTDMLQARVNVEAELVKQERLAVLGQLTATVSHELRNPLGTINNCLTYLKRYGKDDNPVIAESTDNAITNVQRCNDIIGDLLNYTRQQALEIIPTEFNPWLGRILDEYEHAPEIEINRHLEGRAEIGIDAEHLRRVIINLLDNACQAMLPFDGQETKVEKVNRQLTVTTEVNGDWLDVLISDTGGGILAEHLPRIFEPFYSNKSFGTGLGLPTVEKIMELHGGSVSVSSDFGRSTTFTLRLPLKANELRFVS